MQVQRPDSCGHFLPSDTPLALTTRGKHNSWRVTWPKFCHTCMLAVCEHVPTPTHKYNAVNYSLTTVSWDGLKLGLNVHISCVPSPTNWNSILKYSTHFSTFHYRSVGNPYKDVVNKLADRVWDDIFKLGAQIDDFLERNPEMLYFKALFHM